MLFIISFFGANIKIVFMKRSAVLWKRSTGAFSVQCDAIVCVSRKLSAKIITAWPLIRNHRMKK